MAFDACMMRCVLWEFSNEFPEAKIEKVLQPQNDEVAFVVHYGKSSRRLVFNVGPNAPRLQLSDITKENPPQAPMFCMLLRKHLLGAKIVGVSQPGFDRIADFTIQAYDEMGYQTTKHVICEIMGKYANLILLDSEYKIISALKVIDFASSSVRQVLPGLKYQIPDMTPKIIPMNATRADFDSALSSFDSAKTAEKFITGTYSGIATQIAREIVYRTAGQLDVPIAEIDTEALYRTIAEWQSRLINHAYRPTMATDKNGKPTDYSYMEIGYLGEAVSYREFDSFSGMMDAYFAERDRLERIHQRAHDIITLINNAEARTHRKLAIQREALLSAEHAEEHKRRGELITANLYRLERGATSFETIDYYDESAPTVTIELDGRLSPSANAQRCFKLYNKAKTAKLVLTEQIALWESELDYLATVRAFLERSECEDDLAEIRDELYNSGYASRMKGYKSPRKIKSSPYTFKTSGGFTLMVGKNNIQNDKLTFKTASKDDLWFHTKDIPGSHVILITEGEEPGDIDYTEACQVAAYYSQAKGDNVAVDYTRVRNIKKPQGAKPGFVIYKTNYTAYVDRKSGEEIGNG